VRADSFAIGSASTTLALAIPDTLLAYGGKLIFALFTAVIATVISELIKSFMRKRTK
jgi:hypothetical protein